MSTLNTTEAAKALKIHENRVLKLIDGGEIPAAKIGRAWVMLERDVMDYIERQIQLQTAERLGRRSPRNAARSRAA